MQFPGTSKQTAPERGRRWRHSAGRPVRQLHPPGRLCSVPVTGDRGDGRLAIPNKHSREGRSEDLIESFGASVCDICTKLSASPNERLSASQGFVVGKKSCFPEVSIYKFLIPFLFFFFYPLLGIEQWMAQSIEKKNTSPPLTREIDFHPHFHWRVGIFLYAEKFPLISTAHMFLGLWGSCESKRRKYFISHKPWDCMTTSLEREKSLWPKKKKKCPLVFLPVVRNVFCILHVN